MADPLKARRQGMQQKTADKLIGAHRHLPWLMSFLGPILFVLECHLAVFHIAQSVIADGDAMSIAAQILDNLTRAAEWRLGVNNPFTLGQRRQQGPKRLALGELGEYAMKRQQLLFEGRLQCLEKQAAEEARQHTHTEKEAGAAVDPTGMIGPQAATGHYAMDVRMVRQGLPPGMKNGEEPDFGAEVFWVQGYGLESGRSGVEQKFVEHGLILQRQRIELFGDGEDDVVIVDGQQFSLALFDPLLAGQVLALRAVAVTAGNGDLSITCLMGSLF